MPFLTISGTTVDVMADPGSSSEKTPRRIGTSTEAFAKNLISTVRGRKRDWEFTTVPLSQATFETLETAVANGAFVDCTGDALSGDTISCEVTITEAGYFPTSGSFLRVLKLALKEV